MIEGLSHITFIVRDLQKTTQFLQQIFDAREVYFSGDKKFSLSREKFFIIGNIWIAIMEGNPRVTSGYDHVAFKISENEFDNYVEKLSRMDITVKPPRPRIEGEGRSIYFYDYDDHLFELHTGTLEDRLTRYAS